MEREKQGKERQRWKERTIERDNDGKRETTREREMRERETREREGH